MATNEKIQLKGASQYKKDLQQIVAESKALASEMNLVKSSFDKSTSAQQKNEAIGKQLSKQIETQQKYVDKLREAYEAEVAASGEQSTAALKAKDALNKAQTALNNMETENRELEEAENSETEATNKNAEAHEKHGNVLKAAGVAIAAVAAAVAATAKALWDATTAAGAWADNLITLSAQTDISTDTLQKWDYAARFIDVDTNTMAKGLQKIQSEQTKAIGSKKKYIQILGGEKIALKDANGEMKTTEQVFFEAIDAIGAIKDETKRNAAAQDLFGKSYADLKPLIDGGSEALRAYCQEAEELGIVLSDDDVSALGEFDDEMNRFQANMEAAGKKLAVAFLPVTKDVAETLTELAQTISTALSDGFDDSDVDTILDAIFGKLSDGFDNLDEVLPSIQKFVSGFIEKILEFAIENFPTLAKTALEIIVGLAESLVETITSNFGLFIDAALEIIQSLATGLAENLPTLIPAIVGAILLMVETLSNPENTAMMMDAAIALIMGLTDGLIAAIPLLIQQLPQIVINIVNSLIKLWVKLGEAGKSFVDQLGTSIDTHLGEMIAKVKQWVQEKIIQPVKDKVESIKAAGKDLVEGLWNGINDKFEWIKNKIKTWVGNVLKFFKNLLGISSPSTVFYNYGVNVSRGFADGITGGMGYVRNALGTMSGVGTSFDAAPYGVGGSVINIYPQQLDNGTMDYIFARVNARMGAAI